jgi:CBS domain containing-hemolysin-like protein
MPVYRETLDEVIGLVHIKDLAGLSLNGGEEKRTLADLVRTVLFVSPAVRVLDLLLEMRLKRSHMALVVDEYGGIDGLVTIEDVVEQIVGEIEDEHDGDEEPQLKDQADGTILADARVPLDVFEERVGKVFTDEERDETDTLGGVVASIAGRVPGRGALIKHSSGIEFEVVDSDPRRLRLLRVRNLPQEPETG